MRQLRDKIFNFRVIELKSIYRNIKIISLTKRDAIANLVTITTLQGRKVILLVRICGFLK